MLILDDKNLFRNQCYINGQWIEPLPGETMTVSNPATGAVIGTVPKLNAARIQDAIQAAHAALPAWRRRLAAERSALLRRWHDLILENKEDLARLMTAEQGKPLAESRGEIAYAASFIEWFAEEGKRVYGDTIPTFDRDKRVIVVKEPVGVCAAITPWNFPAAMIARKAGPALAVGCTLIVKPAEQTPYSALALAALAERAGIPPGVFNIVTGDADVIGRELTGHPLVRKLTFTGSTETGRLLMKQCSATVKRLSLELSGNAPFIVFDDASLDDAVEGAVASKYRNTGQTCVCANRFFIHDRIYDAFAAALAQRVQKFIVGDGFACETQQGPLINQHAVMKVEAQIANAVRKGAQIVLGGQRHELGGNFFQPTILADVTPEMAVAREETFGPVAPLIRFTTEEDVIRMANDTDSGLAAYLYSRDIGRVWRVSEALEYGMVGINTGLISTAVAPFGGMKQSGIGREGSRYGIDDYLEIKYLCIGIGGV
jgi:succinate-semialdehyde dehydrogenase/glutarate-semialdehyde dehydrogenase